MTQSSEVVSDFGISEEGDLILKVYLRDILLTDGLFTIARDSKVYLPLAELMSLLDFPVIVDQITGTASGWYLKPQNVFELSTSSKTVLSGSAKHELQDNTVLSDDFDLFIDAKALQMWFPLFFDVSREAQVLNIRSSEKLPKELARERSLRTVKNDVMFAATRHYNIPGYRLLDWPEITVGLGGFYSEQSGDARSDYRVRAVGDFAFMSGKVGLSGSDGSISGATVTLGRSNPQGMFGPLKIADFEVGDTSQFLPGMIGSSLSGRGLRFGNSRLADRRDLDTIDLQGEQQEGYEVELYVNDRLRGVDRESVDSVYDFQQVPLRLGQNEIRLEFYGPQGQRYTETRRNFVGGGQGRKGRLDYEVAVVEPGQRIYDLFQENADRETADGGLLSNISLSSALTLSYGVSSRTSVSLAFASLAAGEEGATTSSNEKQNRLYSNVRVSTDVAGVLMSGDITIDPNGHMAGQVAARTTLGAYELGATQRLFQREFRNTDAIASDDDINTVGSLPQLATSVNLSRQFFKVAGGRLSYGGDATFRQNQANNSSSSLGTRVDYQTPKLDLAWSHTHTLQEDAGNGRWSGQIAARLPAGLLRQWSLSTDIQYRQGGERFVNTGSLRVARPIGAEGALGFTATRDLELLDTRYSASWNRRFRPFSLSTSLAGTSAEDVSVRVGIEMTARRYPGRWLPTISSSGGSAAIAVLVFGDDNDNGAYDDGEPVLEGIRITRNGLMAGVATDQNGVALLTGLSSNSSVDVGILETDIKEPGLKYNGIKNGVLSRPGRVPLLQVALQRATDIEGTVTFAGSKPAPNVRMVLTPIDGEREPLEIFTEYDGYYYLAHVPLGVYDFGPDPDQLKAAGLVAETPSRRMVLENLDDFPPPEDFNLLRLADLDNNADELIAAAGAPANTVINTTIDNPIATDVHSSRNIVSLTDPTNQVTLVELPAVFSTPTRTVPDAAGVLSTTHSRASDIKSAEWVLAQGSGDYTLQLLTSVDHALVLKEVEKIPSSFQPAIYIFKRTPSGRPVYGLSVGVYTTAWKALRAADSLPEVLKTYRPWVRKFGDLHTEIAQNR